MSAIRRLSVALAFATLGTSLSSCVKDRDLDNYKQEKVDQEVSRLQSMTGSYRGTIKSRKDGSQMGSLVVELEADKRVNIPSGSYKPEQQAVLRGRVSFQGRQKVVMAFRDGYMNADNGNFKSMIPIQLTPPAGSAEIEMSGQVIGDRLDGSLDVYGFPDSGGTFSLVKDGPLPDPASLAPGSASAQSDGIIRTYAGEAPFGGRGPRPMELVLLDNKTTAEERFLDLLRPVHTLQATIRLSENLQVLFTDTQWDEQLGTLAGRARVDAGGQKSEFGLNCKLVPGSTETAGWNCRVLNNQLGELAAVAFRPGSAVLAREAAIVRSYAGMANFGGGKPRPVRMTLSAGKLAPEEEYAELFLFRRKVRVNMDFDSTIEVAFPDTTWDERADTLTGRTHLQIGGPGSTDSRELALDCAAKDLSGARGWSCSYFSSGLATATTFDLAPVQQ